MKKFPQMNGNHAPVPVHSTDKRWYESRKGVTPTTTPGLAFNSTTEGAMRAMAPSKAMDYTSIEDKPPTAIERGHVPWQASKGKMNNSFNGNG